MSFGGKSITVNNKEERCKRSMEIERVGRKPHFRRERGINK
jgi:hypothetical protein